MPRALADVAYGDDVRVAGGRQSAGFPSEALETARLATDRPGQDLEGDLLTVSPVASLASADSPTVT